MGALEKASQYAAMTGCSVLDAAYTLLGLGSLNIFELEEVEEAEAAKALAATEE